MTYYMLEGYGAERCIRIKRPLKSKRDAIAWARRVAKKITPEQRDNLKLYRCKS